MPTIVIDTPIIVNTPAVDEKRLSPAIMGGISVPKAAQSPNAILCPRATPRYRILRPNVKPPNPHNAPKIIAINFAEDGASWIIGKSSPFGTKINANNIGAINQAATPCVIQYDSHAHDLTFLNGT